MLILICLQLTKQQHKHSLWLGSQCRIALMNERELWEYSYRAELRALLSSWQKWVLALVGPKPWQLRAEPWRKKQEITVCLGVPVHVCAGLYQLIVKQCY